MADQPRDGGKFSPDDVQKHIRRIQELVEAARREKKGENFTALTPEEIERKLRRVNSPFITMQSWDSKVPPGGTILYEVGIYNPDPVDVYHLFVHVWVGSGNVDPTVGTFLLNVDTRFPRLTEPPFSGLILAPGASATVQFTIPVPTTIETTNYMGNSCLMQVDWHDVGAYLDRGVFVFQVA